jgi:hypothetical protein
VIFDGYLGLCTALEPDHVQLEQGRAGEWLSAARHFQAPKIRSCTSAAPVPVVGLKYEMRMPFHALHRRMMIRGAALSCVLLQSQLLVAQRTPRVDWYNQSVGPGGGLSVGPGGWLSVGPEEASQ